MFSIKPLSTGYQASILDVINLKTKPLGALGRLEQLALQLTNIQCNFHQCLITEPKIVKPCMLVFAGDHGIAEYGVSIAPSAVTGQMLVNFTENGAAINVFCRQLGWQLQLVDCGVLTETKLPLVRSQRLGSGTKPFHLEPAMTLADVELGFEYAKQLVQEKHQQGCDLFAFGEMGIGNTSAASAIMSAIMQLPANETVGLGTGIAPDVLVKKQQFIQQALDRHQVTQDRPIDILAAYGGFEIVQICGAILAAAELRLPVLIDGFICTAAAMVAKLIAPNVQDYLIFAHASGEQGHKRMLDWFEATPLLQLDLRLGEGTGAALTLPLIQSALAFYNQMASFEQANVDNVVG